MNRVRLIHWNILEAKQKATILRVAGYEVNCEPLTPKTLRELKANPPNAVVIDLTRLPTQGRDIAFAVRHYKPTRHIPLIFVDGAPEKVARIKAQLPDAIYTTWDRVCDSLEHAIAHPPKVKVVPRSLLDGYSSTPLAKKLGIKANSVIALINAPKGIEKTLGELPEGAMFAEPTSKMHDLIIWFTRSRKDLENGISRMRNLPKNEGLWIMWPKTTSQISSDLSQVVIRKAGLAAGLVDYKVCSFDATWSGLLFSRRKSE